MKKINVEKQRHFQALSTVRQRKIQTWGVCGFPACSGNRIPLPTHDGGFFITKENYDYLKMVVMLPVLIGPGSVAKHLILHFKTLRCPLLRMHPCW
jgi:hypothetical protein